MTDAVVRFHCQSCGKPATAAAKHAGKTAKCPTCGEPMLIPSTSVEASGALREPPTATAFPGSHAPAAAPSPPYAAIASAPPQTIACPHCSQSMDFAVDLCGTLVACPRCSGQFTMPGPGAMALPLAASQPPPEERPAIPAGNSTARSYLTRRTPNAQGWRAVLWLFDWRFERYLTPWIIRGMWILFLTLAFLGLAWTCLSTIVSHTKPEASVQELPAFDRRELTPQPGLSEPAFGEPPRSRLKSTIDFQGAFGVLMFAMRIVGTIMVLLGLRVVCESIIVLFNIANTLSAIEKQLKET